MMVITGFKHWTPDSVRKVCIDNQLYTQGSSEDYEQMLNMTKDTFATTNNIYKVAENIVEHSEEQTISNVMYLIANNAVTTTFEITE